MTMIGINFENQISYLLFFLGLVSFWGLALLWRTKDSFDRALDKTLKHTKKFVP